MDLKVELQQGIEKCEKLELGLCLSCIKTKELLKEESGICLYLCFLHKTKESSKEESGECLYL